MPFVTSSFFVSNSNGLQPTGDGLQDGGSLHEESEHASSTRLLKLEKGREGWLFLRLEPCGRIMHGSSWILW